MGFIRNWSKYIFDSPLFHFMFSSAQLHTSGPCRKQMTSWPRWDESGRQKKKKEEEKTKMLWRISFGTRGWGAEVWFLWTRLSGSVNCLRQRLWERHAGDTGGELPFFLPPQMFCSLKGAETWPTPLFIQRRYCTRRLVFTWKQELKIGKSERQMKTVFKARLYSGVVCCSVYHTVENLLALKGNAAKKTSGGSSSWGSLANCDGWNRQNNPKLFFCFVQQLKVKKSTSHWILAKWMYQLQTWPC